MKNDVEKFIKENVEKEGFTYDQLSETTKQIVAVYRKIKEKHDLRKEGGEHLAGAESAGKAAIDSIKVDLQKLKSDGLPKKVAGSKKEKKTTDKDKEAHEKTTAVLGKLDHCKVLIKKERERKIANGEIKKPVPQTRFTKLRNAFVRIFKVLPSESEKDVVKTRDELLETIKNLFNLHGISKPNLLADAVKEVANKQIMKLAKQKK